MAQKEFVAVITHRSFGDTNGVGHPMQSISKTFASSAPIEEVWEWYLSDNCRGILEICLLNGGTE